MNAKGSFNIDTKYASEPNVVNGRKVTEYETKDSYITSSEVKFLTALNGTSTEARFNNKGVCKLWTNWGVHVKICLYFSY